jgi:Flp pilus assembly protein TadG
MPVAPIPTRKTRRGLFRRLSKDRRGATAVEFSMILVPLIGFLLVGLQSAIIFFYDEALQSVAYTAARSVMTGKVQDAGQTQSQFATFVCGLATPEFNCSNLMIDIQSANSFSALNTTPITISYNGSGAPTNTFAFSPGNPGDVVIMRVMYNWPVVGGPFAYGLANQSNGSHLLIATVVFKDEPYQ